MKNDMSLYSILKSSLRRLLAFGLVMAMMMGFVPGLRIEVNHEGEISVKKEESPFIAMAKAAEGDPLQSVAAVTTGGNASSYVDINSNYELPEGGRYTTLESGKNGYVDTPGTYFSYHTNTNGSTTNSWIVTPMRDLSWAPNSTKTGVTGSVSDTATADYNGDICGDLDNYGNGALCAKVNSQVIQIKALADISISFAYSSEMTITARSGEKGTIDEGVYALKTTSASPTISQIMNANNVRSSTSVDKGKEASATGTVTESLRSGEYLYLYFFGFVNDQDSPSVDSTTYTYSASVTNFQITPVTQSYSLTVGNRDCADNLVVGGKITVNGVDTAIPAAGTATAVESALSGTYLNLSVASVPNGYFHIGWQMGEETIFEKTIDFSLESNTTVYALLIPEVTVTMGSSGYSDAAYAYKTPSGATVNKADQYIARNSDSTAYYKTLAEAFSANDVVVLLGNIVLNGDFTIPRGKTLSLQHDWDDPATSELQTTADTAGVSIFAKATINGTVTVEGDLVASAVQSDGNAVNGRAAGGVGQFIVNGTVNVSSGGNLYAYGMFTGPGKIYVAPGGTVYELMEIRDMRSIYVLSDAVSGDAFPLNHYFVKTNEVTTTYSKGAKLLGCYFVSVSGVKSGGEASVIGENDSQNQSMFMIERGSLTKSFSSSAPYNNKIIFRAESGSDIQSGKFTISIKTSMGTYPIDTSKYYFPLSYCYAVEILDGGSLTLDGDYKLLPGAVFDVQKGGTLTIPSGKNLVLYRANDYGFAAMSGFSTIAYPGSFTKPSGLQYATNTAANVGSAKLIVNGTLNVDGGLYVTDQLTDKTPYNNGYNYLTGTGTININSELEENGSISEWTQPANDSIEEATVSYVPIKGLTNYRATSDDGKTDYTSFTEATWYGYINDSGINVWSKSKPVTLSYNANTGSGEPPAPLRVPAETAITVAANTFTAPGKKEFGGWNTVADGSGDAYSEGAPITINKDMTLYAQWNAVSIVNGTTVTKYTTLGKAVEAYGDPSENKYIRMISDSSEEVTLVPSTVIDLNGCTVTNVKLSGGTLYGADSSSDGFKEPSGSITISGDTVAEVANVNGKDYVKIENNGTYQFWRFAITPSEYSFYLDPRTTEDAHSHLGIMATVQGHETVLTEIENIGFTVSGLEWSEEKNAFNDKETISIHWYTTDKQSEFTKEELKNLSTISFIALDFKPDSKYFDTEYTFSVTAKFKNGGNISVTAPNPIPNEEDPDSPQAITFNRALRVYLDVLDKRIAEAGAEAGAEDVKNREIISNYLNPAE